MKSDIIKDKKYDYHLIKFSFIYEKKNSNNQCVCDVIITICIKVFKNLDRDQDRAEDEILSNNIK